MQADNALHRPDLLVAADAISREKRLDRNDVITAMEQAIQVAAAARYGQERDIRATIDRRTGDIRVARWTKIVDTASLMPDETLNPERQIALEIACRIKPDAKDGAYIIDQLPPVDFGRISAQTARQVIVQKVRDSERKRTFEDYKDRVGEIVNGEISTIEYGNFVIDLGGGAAAILRKSESIPRESFKVGDRVRAYITGVNEDGRGPQVILSRTHPNFLAKLFAQEVPEIYDGIIEIKAVARDPGSRAKMAVLSRDLSIDPVGACVGMRGSRVQAVVQELGGERVDIIPWSPQIATFIVNALAPAEVTRVVIDEENGKVEVVVPENQLSLGIGRRGQNVRLASQLTHLSIDLMTEEEDKTKRDTEAARRIALFQDELNADEMLARLLATEGFATLEDLAYGDLDDLASIDALGRELAEAIQQTALDALARREEKLAEQAVELGQSPSIGDVSGLSGSLLLTLAQKKILSLDDLADLAAYELIELTGDVIDQQMAEEIIMAARAHWFSETEAG
jgi:N utilization substance protein A